MTEEIETETQAKIAMIKNCVKKEYVKNEKNSVYIYEESQTKKKDIQNATCFAIYEQFIAIGFENGFIIAYLLIFIFFRTK